MERQVGTNQDMAEGDLRVRLAQRGFRMTPQRRVIAEELHRRAAERLPEISLATVYEILDVQITFHGRCEV